MELMNKIWSRIKHLNKEKNLRANYIGKRLGWKKALLVMVVCVLLGMIFSDLIMSLAYSPSLYERYTIHYSIARFIIAVSFAYVFYFKHAYELIKGMKSKNKGFGGLKDGI